LVWQYFDLKGHALPNRKCHQKAKNSQSFDYGTSNPAGNRLIGFETEGMMG
jgi:hypothetical protein